VAKREVERGSENELEIFGIADDLMKAQANMIDMQISVIASLSDVIKELRDEINELRQIVNIRI